MKKIEFNKNKYEIQFTYQANPTLHIIKVHYVTDNNDWLNRLSHARLSIKTIVLDKDSQVIASQENELDLIKYITPQHNQPVLEINQAFQLSNNLPIPPKEEIYDKWKVNFRISGIDFDEREGLNVFLTSS